MLVRVFGVFVSSLIAGGVFFALTNPSTIPVVALMIPIILIFSIFASGTYLFLRVFWGGTYTEKHASLAILAGIIASLVTLFQSTGGIVWGDIIILLPLIIISYIYINKY